MMHPESIAVLSISLLLGACAGMPDMDPPQESQAKAPRTEKQAEQIAPAARSAASPVYDSGVWIARRKPEPAAEPPMNPARSWEVAAGDKTLRQTLARWAADAGWQLVWEIGVDYEIQARTSVSGTFEQAMESVAAGMRDAEVPLTMIFYKANKVVRIVAKGAQ